MKISRAIISLIIITLIYLSVLFWSNSNKDTFELLPNVFDILPILFLFSVLSYIIRYLRWHWLLTRCNKKIPLLKGFLSYLTGFAFTATPGKIGELIRIRYFQTYAVENHYVISAFIYERFFDLIIVLLLSSLIAVQVAFFKYVLGFVVVVIIVILFIASNPKTLNFLILITHKYRLKSTSRLIITGRKGLIGIKKWCNFKDVIISLALGLVAWSSISFSFIFLLNHLDIQIPFIDAIAIYPLSMLAGAASMIPGGAGTTEVTIVGLLAMYNIPLSHSLLIAISIRFSTLWFAIVCGLITIFILEYRNLKSLT